MTDTTTLPPTFTFSAHSAEPIDAVLFDLSGTTLDEAYARAAVATLAAAIQDRYGIDPSVTASSFITWMRTASKRFAREPYHRMTDAVAAALAGVLGDAGCCAAANELADLEAIMWAGGVRAAQPAPGALAILAGLRARGIRTGIVSYADTHVFRPLLDASGLAGATDVELCSEQAQSCKPDARIFLLALAQLRVPPARALFVGDSIDADIVGANRVGMRTALLVARAFALDTTNDDTDRHRRPTHVVTSLAEVADLLAARTGPLR